MSMAYPTGTYDTSYTSTTYSDIGTGASTTYYTDEAPELDYDFDKIKKLKPTHYSDYSISYDPEAKKFIVNRGLDYQDKEFATKRSAKRFAEKWLNKKNGIKVKKIPIYEQYKQKAIEKRELAERLELMRIARLEQIELAHQMAIQAKIAREAQELADEEDEYFERLGIWDE